MDTSWWLALGAVVVIALVASVSRVRPGGRTRPPGRRAERPARAPSKSGRGPRPGEIWWADVPYEDGPGSKDRPCLVLQVHGGAAHVAKITSKYRDARPGVIPLPPGTVGDAQGRASFLETDELRKVRVRDFRRRVGTVDPLLWDQVRHLAP
ncbi:type II toxin-antitoxin system PemK/MazF family toxin [Streptomyces sp. NPDC057445]|uniref:type II toxin-antitoxin system PemK/MazF family toxin n=1 Tax=Streptomyces sp. NPDC057445 TaxID=3346136 RepID=UPI0036BA9AEE